ncbi:coiled-coil domain-containing protein 112-like isoform X2 [Linepithema humile]|uniref:coiled-coil domain-containing protein 112-like isoform X2 n=1 Tax=Linepithema humile TaxID=83485 RepID=UPI0006233674|nr:PREDICTED: coiled-coil domain-containing protein 112-like [Linepithema humile]
MRRQSAYKKEKQILSCKKVHSAENTKNRKALLKLMQQEHLMEKNLANLMENMKLEPEVLRSVLHNMSDISKTRQIFVDNVKKSLEEIAEELRSAKSITNFLEKIQKLDTNAYKQRLVRLSRKIRDFKESCQLETLSQEQTSLESELREFESSLHKYESATGNIGKPTSAAFFNKENKRCHDYKEIHDFHALIAKTGHTDNWSDEDHLLFLKMRKKCNNIPALVAAVQVKCPDLTAEIIVNHEAWYKVYLSLREKQRSSVREWRKQREIEKTKKNCENQTLEETSKDKTSCNLTKELSNRMTDECKGRTAKTDDSVDINNANQKKQLIRRWKEEKENKRSMDEEQSRILIESKLVAQEKRKREKLKRIQEALAEYRERKSMEVSSETSKDVLKAGPKYNPVLIKAFRKQDEEYTRKKKNLIARSRRPNKSRTVKARLQITKRHSTLLNPTKVWKERCRIHNLNSSTKEARKLQYIKDVPRLYVQWRNRESTEIKDTLASL